MYVIHVFFAHAYHFPVDPCLPHSVLCCGPLTPDAVSRLSGHRCINRRLGAGKREALSPHPPLGASGGIPGSGCISSIFPAGSYEVPAPTGGLNGWVPGKPPLPHGIALHSEVGGWGWGGFLRCYSLVCLTIACLASEPFQHLKEFPVLDSFHWTFWREMFSWLDAGWPIHCAYPGNTFEDKQLLVKTSKYRPPFQTRSKP